MYPIACLDITHLFSYHFPPYKTTKQQNLVKKKSLNIHPKSLQTLNIISCQIEMPLSICNFLHFKTKI